MTDKKNKDVFLDFVKGATPIKKTNKQTRPVPKINNITELKNLKKDTSSVAPTLKEKQKNIPHTKFKIEKININKKLKKRQIYIEKKIDFHGHTLIQAKLIFIKTINDCFFEKKRCILFITGKGVRNKSTSTNEQTKRLYYGKIRNNFMNWVELEEVVQKILSVEKAGTTYGCDGAFIIYLRKNKN